MDHGSFGGGRGIGGANFGVWGAIASPSSPLEPPLKPYNVINSGGLAMFRHL